MTIVERILARVEVSPDGCLLFTGALSSHGYGNVGLLGKTYRAHRVMFEAFVGPIPDGLEPDHLCRVRHCVNPAHLEAVTHRENAQRGARGRMITRCAQGHEYTPENTVIRSDGRRRCRQCQRVNGRASYARHRQARLASQRRRDALKRAA